MDRLTEPHVTRHPWGDLGRLAASRLARWLCRLLVVLAIVSAGLSAPRAHALPRVTPAVVAASRQGGEALLLGTSAADRSSAEDASETPIGGDRAVGWILALLGVLGIGVGTVRVFRRAVDPDAMAAMDALRVREEAAQAALAARLAQQQPAPRPPAWFASPEGRQLLRAIGGILLAVAGVAVGWTLMARRVGPLEGTSTACQELLPAEEGACASRSREVVTTMWHRLDLDADSTFVLSTTLQRSAGWAEGTVMARGTWSVGTSHYIQSGEPYKYVRLTTRDALGQSLSHRLPLVAGTLRYTLLDEGIASPDVGAFAFARGDRFPGTR